MPDRPSKDQIIPSRDEIIALEKDFWEAMKRKDGERASGLTGATALTTSMRGVARVPKEKMGQVTAEGNWTLKSYSFDDVEFIAPSNDLAIIAYKVRQSVTMDGKQQEMTSADISIWVRGANGWECHAHSETPLQDRKAA